jgi:Skp family chaperone for outer membrane proteins
MTTIFVVDLGRILDESQKGQEGAAELNQLFEEARAAHAKKGEEAEKLEGLHKAEAQAERARMEADALNTIETKRSQMRKALLAEAHKIIERVAKKKGADLVVEKAFAPYVGEAITDITDTVIRSLNKKSSA